MHGAVHPAEVLDLRARLGPAFAELGATGEAGALRQAWGECVGRAVEWWTAPDELEAARDLEARLHRLSMPSHTTGQLIATPGDVLAYRKTWDPYVLGVARAALACADAWDAAAKGKADPTLNVAQFAAAPDAKTMALWATSQRQNAAMITSLWNQWQGIPDWEILTKATDILKDFQATVHRIGTEYVPLIQRDCPKVPIPDPPSLDVQSQVIGQIEGLGIIAAGVLQLMGIGSDGFLEFFGAIGHGAKELVHSASSALPLIAAGVGLGLVLIIARK